MKPYILTKRQTNIFEYLKNSFQSRGYWPSIREVQAEFGFKSTNAVIGHLKALEAKQFLTKIPGSARAYKINHAPANTFLEMTTIPLYGSIAAGYPDFVESGSAVEHLQVDMNTAGWGRSKNATFALKVKGDSMIDAGINEGDIVVIEKRPPQDNDIVAALIDQETTLKRFIRKSDQIAYLKAENKHYPTLYPMNELLVQGVAKAVIRALC